MKRTFVYVDGYNLYHAIKDLGKNHLKWVSLWDMSQKLLKEDQKLVAVKYFSSYAKWIEESYRRHQKYVAALEANGVTFIEGRFKRNPSECLVCKNKYLKPEEKETDVNIASHLIADGLKDRYDCAIVISADTDLNGAVKIARKETKSKLIELLAPPGRQKRNSKTSFAISENTIEESLLPKEIQTKGEPITRPEEYDPPL